MTTTIHDDQGVIDAVFLHTPDDVDLACLAIGWVVAGCYHDVSKWDSTRIALRRAAEVGDTADAFIETLCVRLRATAEPPRSADAVAELVRHVQTEGVIQRLRDTTEMTVLRCQVAAGVLKTRKAAPATTTESL